MIDANYIINNRKVVLEKLANKNYNLDFTKFSDLYMSRKESIQKEEDLKAKLNFITKVRLEDLDVLHQILFLYSINFVRMFI